MQIFPYISLRSNEENKKAVTPDEKEMAFEMTRMHFFVVAPKVAQSIGYKQNKQILEHTFGGSFYATIINCCIFIIFYKGKHSPNEVLVVFEHNHI